MYRVTFCFLFCVRTDLYSEEPITLCDSRFEQAAILHNLGKTKYWLLNTYILGPADSAAGYSFKGQCFLTLKIQLSVTLSLFSYILESYSTYKS